MGEKYKGGIVVAMGTHKGDRYVMTVDKDYGVGLWFEPW